jgi:hypothetical protein
LRPGPNRTSLIRRIRRGCTLPLFATIEEHSLITRSSKSAHSDPASKPAQGLKSPAELRYELAAVRLFVVWHPRYAGGEAAFKALYDWMGGPNRDLYRRGLGVPVQAWTSGADEDPPAAIPIEDQILTIVVPIIDSEFVGRKSWRDWVADCQGTARDSERLVVILPWAVHQAAALIPGIGLLQILGSGTCDDRQLCRRVTEACVVRVRDPKQLKPIRIFISYARRDGAEIANEVRRVLQSYGHLSVFLDEHDLQPGEQWRKELLVGLSQGSAMFAIVTDAYASRAWCREELREFREPRRDESDGVWYLRPARRVAGRRGRRARRHLRSARGRRRDFG